MIQDDDDFERLFREHYQGLLRQAHKLLGQDGAAAEDAVAEVFLWAWERRDDAGRPSVQLLMTWTRYAALHQTSRHGAPVDIDPYAQLLVEEPGRGTPYPGLADPATHAAWAEVMPYLTERQAVAVWLFCVGGYNVDEAAQQMGGLTALQVRHYKNSALDRIRSYFGGRLSARAQVCCPRCQWPRYSIGCRTTCGGVGERRAVGPVAATGKRGDQHDDLIADARAVARELAAAGSSITRDAMASALRARGHTVGTNRAAALARAVLASTPL